MNKMGKRQTCVTAYRAVCHVLTVKHAMPCVLPAISSVCGCCVLTCVSVMKVVHVHRYPSCLRCDVLCVDVCVCDEGCACTPVSVVSTL